ncbi:MAG: RsmB/NOP family class I SAM-dependent RNA methyltransferase [Myxococcaceae bacterium]
MSPKKTQSVKRPERRRAPPPKRTSSAPQRTRSGAPREREREEDTQRERPLREDLVTQTCLEAYGAIRHDGRLSDRAIDFTLRHKKLLYANERRAVAERVYALLRRQLTVDKLLARAEPRFDTFKSSRQDLLRLCASRVLQGDALERIAKGALLTEDDAAIVRRLPDAAKWLDRLPREQRFAVAASLPEFLARKLREEFGDAAEAAAEAMNERAPLNARVNTLKTTREALIARLTEAGVVCHPTPLSPLGLVLETRINAFSLDAFKDGELELQDEGSQLLGMLVDPPPTKVVDACAGAGGKTLQLAAAMKNRGDLHALDIDERRMADLRKRARRAGVHNARVRVIPPTGTEKLSDLTGKVDRVLVDAPCSGSGTYRRKPDARYRLTPEELTQFSARQSELLERFSTLVKPGGRIIYGTCSVLREENEDVVEKFLAKHPEFSVRPVSEELGPELGKKVSRDGFLRLSPHLHGTDGFFGAILVRHKGG